MSPASTSSLGRGCALACVLVLLLAACQSPPPTDPKAELRRQRDAVQARLSQPAEAEDNDAFELATLNRHLGAEPQTLAFFDTLSGGNPARVFVARQIVRELVARQRYADALLGWDGRYVRRIFSTEGKTFPHHALLQGLDYYEILVAAGDPTEAQMLAGQIGAFDTSPETLALLRQRAARAGHPDLPQTRRLKGGERIVRPVSKLTRFRQAMVSQPDFRARTLAEVRSHLGDWYGFLYLNLALSPEGLDHLKDLQIRRAAAAFDLTAQTSPRGALPEPDTAVRQQAVSSAADRVDAQIRDAFGDKAFLRYQAYEAKLSRWLTASMLEAALRASSTPLTPSQAEQLVEAYNTFTPGDLAGHELGLVQMSGTEPLPYPQPASPEVRAKAADFLSPPQLAALHRIGQQIELGWDEEERVDPIDPDAAPTGLVANGPTFEVRAVDRVPAPVSQAAPEYPPELRQTGISGEAIVDFLVYPDGSVRGAHALSASQPQFAAAAVAAVSQWKFRPGEHQGVPVICHMAIPVVFQLDPEQVTRHVNFEIGPAAVFPNLRTGARVLQFTLQPSGDAAGDVRAGRVFVTRAEDDRGTVLRQSGTPLFSHVSVGRTSDAVLTSVREPIQFSVEGPAPDATQLRRLDARVEIYVPLLDPGATGVVDHLPSHFGQPVPSAALLKAGITLTVFDQASAQRQAAAKAPGGPQDFDSGQMFGADYLDPAQPPAVARAMRAGVRANLAALPPEVRRRILEGDTMGPDDLAVGLHDPDQRLIALEFQNADGSPIRYPHNGSYHTERTSEGKRFDLYRLSAPLSADARLVCWIQTPDSVVSSEFNLTDIPLPSK